MVVLGIESSCDDSAAAVLKDGALLSSVVSSQDAVHGPYGGVVPELASRHHVRNLLPVVDAALARACLGLGDIDGIAVTCGPGLVGSLLVGLTVAKGIAQRRRLPLVGVNHLEGHALSVRLTEACPFPYLLLLISGGHTQLLRVDGVGQYQRLGTTIDDAAGEAFDPSPKNIESRTVRSPAGGLKMSLLSKQTRGDTVVANLVLRFGDEKSLMNRAMAAPKPDW